MLRALKSCLLVSAATILACFASPAGATTPTTALVANITESECDSQSPDYGSGNMRFSDCVHISYLSPISTRRYWVAPGGQINLQFFVGLSEQGRTGPNNASGARGPMLHANYTINVSATDVSSPANVATNSATLTLYGSASAEAPAGANQLAGWTQLQASPGGMAFTFVNIPINVDWAESYVTFTVTTAQFAGNQDQTVVTEGQSCVRGPLACSGIWTDDGTFFAPSLANVNSNVVLNGLVPANGDFVLVTIPTAAAQLAVLPLAIVYAPVGDKGASSYTVTLSSGSNVTFGSQSVTTAATTNTTDDKISYGGTLNINNLLTAITGTSSSGAPTLQYQGSQDWQTAVQTSVGRTFGSSTSILSGVSLQSGYPNQDCFANPPPLPQVGYYSEPYWCDQIIVSVNSQLALWDYPAGPIVQPLGSLAIATPTIQQLDTCANHDMPPPSTPPTQASLAADPITASHYLVVASPTSSQTLYTWLTATDCAALANLDQFYAQKTQAAFPNSYFTLPDGDVSVNTQTGHSFLDTTSSSASLTGSQSVQATTQVTATATVSNAFTVQEGLGAIPDKDILQATLGVSNTATTSNSQSTSITLNAQNIYTYSTQVQAGMSIKDSSGITAPIDVVQDAIFQGLAPRDTNMTYPKPPVLIPYNPCTPWPLCFWQHLHPHGTYGIERSGKAALAAKSMADFHAASKRHIARSIPPPPRATVATVGSPALLNHIRELNSRDPGIRAFLTAISTGEKAAASKP